MKTMIYIAALSLGLMACSGTKSEQAANNTQENTQQEIATSIDAYMALKDALVKTNAAEAQAAAKELRQKLSNEGMNENLIAAANTLAEVSDVEAQREQFKIITEGLIASLKADDKTNNVYVQYCPMAFDNTGASWLSLSEEIRNPYFGDKMLKCGRVEEKL